jgi:hypothetical protein
MNDSTVGTGTYTHQMATIRCEEGCWIIVVICYSICGRSLFKITRFGYFFEKDRCTYGNDWAHRDTAIETRANIVTRFDND